MKYIYIFFIISLINLMIYIISIYTININLNAKLIIPFYIYTASICST